MCRKKHSSLLVQSISKKGEGIQTLTPRVMVVIPFFFITLKTCRKQNTLAYQYKALVTKGKGLIALTAGIKVVKLFFLHSSENLLKTKHSSLLVQSISKKEKAFKH